MSRLPIIVGFGGINPAGRSSSHHSYRRLVIDKLAKVPAQDTYKSLASLMNQEIIDKQYILEHTLIRKLENNLFDPEAIRIHRATKLSSTNTQPMAFTILKNQMPKVIPQHWQVVPYQDNRVLVTCQGDLEVLLPDSRISKVLSGGQLPTGFRPETLYQSRNHPRGLQLAVYGASDAVNSLGIDWESIRQLVPADQISVYAGCAMGQLDANGAGGLLQSALLGKRVSSKHCPLSLVEMTADFVNAYVLGNVGTTGANIGACATFLYNLRQGIQDIRSGKFRVAIIGASEAPLVPELIEGFRTMGALAEDEELNKIDATIGPCDNARACRPFAENCGFTLGESSQFIILFDDELALATGANIYGAAADVFINADGFKKSISGPGIGNYLTMGKAMGLVRAMLGEQAIKQRTYIQAHGTGTPQNRVAESHIFNELAKAFGIQHWPITAIKAYIGHSLAPASGDQIVTSLGVWAYGIIPGIKTIDKIATDVHASHLDFLLEHQEIDPTAMDAVLINSKGFGGNNATAAIISPHITRNMLKKKYGQAAMFDRDKKNESVQEQIDNYEQSAIAGHHSTIYQFGSNVIAGEDLTLSSDSITIPGRQQNISLQVENPYPDMS